MTYLRTSVMPWVFGTGSVENGFEKEVSAYGEAFEFLQVQEVLFGGSVLYTFLDEVWTSWWWHGLKLSADWLYGLQEDLPERGFLVV
jgi:hypothetical protein